MAKEKNLSDDQAAVLIQSAYRGFEVRKLEPLKKLKQMVEVRDQAAEIRKRIQALESSSDLLKNEKERVLIGEMIMRTLLKLDTIQGLHPSLRDIRKALTKDLVTLQEELDSIAIVAEDDISNDAGMQEVQNKVGGILENSLKTNHDNVVDMKEPDEGNLSSMRDLVVNSQGLETSETALSDTEVQGKCEVRELPQRNSMESQVGESASDMVQVEATNGGVDVSQAVLTENQGKDIMHPQLQQTSSEELTGAQLQDSFDEPKAMNEARIDGVNGGIHVEDNLEAQATELPLILDDEEQPLQELKNSESSRKGKSENVDHEVKLHVLAGSTLPADVDNVDEIGKTARNVDSEINLAAELPIGALEEDLSFENKGSETNSETNLVAELPVGVLEGDLAIENKESEIENLVAELPVGVLEEGEAKESEIGKDKGSSIGEARYNGVTNITTATKSKVVMVDELSGNAVLEMEENLPLSSIEGKVRSDDEVCKNEGKDGGRIDDDQLPSPESAGISVSPQALEVTNEDVQLQGVDGNKEGRVLEKEQQYGEPESMIDIDSRMDEASGSEITTEDTIAATTTSQMSADERDIVMEENAKLREMMEKLMEAGKEQLTVISQLTGRVKDLERKLSRKRKLRGPRRYKRATQSFR
ncbi:BAG family molecular chaperone regulator 6 [Citrus sinensis]|nr:BAG family molecular chaperone regulator 6 [Citrus sinensis]